MSETKPVANPYAAFKTDSQMEKTGIWLDYGDFRIRIARAGGANTQFAKTFSRILKPVRRQLQTETLPDKKAEKLTREAFALSVVLDWEVKQGDDWVRGVHSPLNPTEIVEPSPEVYQAVFEALPELFTDVRDQATKVGLFRQIEAEEDAKNS